MKTSHVGRVTSRFRPRVYLAGPIDGSGSREQNVRYAIEVGKSLFEQGYAPFIPHLDHFMFPDSPPDWEAILEWDEAFVSVCEAVFRISGVSPGADREVALAQTLGIPVVYSFHELEELFADRKEFTDD